MDVETSAASSGGEPSAPTRSKLRLFKMPAQKKKEYWQCIDLIASDEYEGVSRADLTSAHAIGAFCKECKRKVAYSRGNISNVRDHMKKEHAGALDTYVAQQTRKEKPKQSLVSITTAQPEEPLSNRVVVNKEQQKHCDRLIATWIAQSMRPFRTVEDPGFINFVKYVTKNIGGFDLALPDRKTVREEIRCLSQELRVKMMSAIEQQCGDYSVTTDMWTDRSMRSFLCLTLHFIDNNFELQNIVLEVEAFRGKHSGDRIAEALEKAIKRWKLNLAMCTQLVRDGASNAVSAANMLGIDSMSCIAHSLHLVVGAALTKKMPPKQSLTPVVHGSQMEEDDRPAKRPRTTPCNDASASEGLEHEEETVCVSVELETRLEGMPQALREAEEAAAIYESNDAALENLRQETCDEIHEEAAKHLSEQRLSAMKAMRDIVQKFRRIGVYFRKSSKARDRLEVFTTQQNCAPELSVLVDCATRWNSTYDMIGRFIKLEPAMKKFFAFLRLPEGRKEFAQQKEKLEEPSRADWFAIKCLHALLQPFAAVSVFLLKEKEPTICAVGPALHHLGTKLENMAIFERQIAEASEKHSDIEDMMHLIRQGMLELFAKRFTAVRYSLVWLSLLDPRFVVKLLNSPDAERAKRKLLDAMEEAQETEPPTTPSSDAHSVSPVPTPQKGENELYESMFVMPTARAKKKTQEADAPSVRKMCQNEFELYVTCISIGVQQSPLDWWRIHGDQFPTLRRLARKWLGVMATSVPSERAFSTSGNILTIKRASLKRDIVRDLVFVAHNFKA